MGYIHIVDMDEGSIYWCC